MDEVYQILHNLSPLSNTQMLKLAKSERTRGHNLILYYLKFTVLGLTVISISLLIETNWLMEYSSLWNC